MSSKLFCGQLDFLEETLKTYPIVAEALVKLRVYLPTDDTYDSVSRGWEYARTINDKHESLTIYRGRRSNIISKIEKNRSYATYASAYFLLSILSLAFFNFSFIPILVLFSTVILFLLFSRMYLRACVSLADLDIYTFLALAHDEGFKKSEVDLSKKDIVVKPYFTDHINLFKGNIFSAMLGLFTSRDK